MYNKLGGLLIFRRGIKDLVPLSLKTGLHLQQLWDSADCICVLSELPALPFVFSAAPVTVSPTDPEVLALPPCPWYLGETGRVMDIWAVCGTNAWGNDIKAN